MNIAIGSDHAGYFAKETLKSYLEEKGYTVEDLGCFSEESVHYPVYGKAVAQAVSQGQAEKGILICGTGIGMSIVANKIPGIRAALCHDAFTAKASREHNDANILVMGARVLTPEQMKLILEVWLDSQFAGGRHSQRLEMIKELDDCRR
ncbi:MAG: ribose 5-phosphate isomerase B [Firmicutes bacterium]|nr:ribose 5-phosphate isomerase B [Bacillota bacterium]